MLQNVLKSYSLETVNAMHIKGRPNLKKKKKGAKANNQKTKSANKPEITTATVLSIPTSMLMFVVFSKRSSGVMLFNFKGQTQKL